jgi:hypothetical protein
VVLSEHRQNRKRLSEFVALVHRQLADQLQLGVHHAVQELGFPSHGAVAPPPGALLPCRHMHHP